LLQIDNIFEDTNDAEIEDSEMNPLRRSDADEYTREAFDKYLTAEIDT
jgi:hypothetical protein